MGALEVKNRSEAFFSTINLNRGLVLRVGWPVAPLTVSMDGTMVAWGPVADVAAWTPAAGWPEALLVSGEDFEPAGEELASISGTAPRATGLRRLHQRSAARRR